MLVLSANFNRIVSLLELRYVQALVLICSIFFFLISFSFLFFFNVFGIGDLEEEMTMTMTMTMFAVLVNFKRFAFGLLFCPGSSFNFSSFIF